MKKQQLLLPILSVFISGSVIAHGGFVKDSRGVIAITPYGECVRSSYYVSSDAAECPFNKKAEEPMTEVTPEVEPVPVAVKKPTPKPVEMVKPKPAPVVVSTPAPAPTPVVKRIISLDGVNFETSSNKLTGGSLNTLDSVARTLMANPNTKIIVEGYTDNRGDAGFNKSLSQGRAEAVMQHLITQGVSESNISAKGYGEDNAIASNDTSSGRAQNRRVELRILE